VKPSFVPDWLTHEINTALADITGDHVAKKETTVLRLAQAVANGEAVSSVFGAADTCSRTIWYGNAKKPGWKDDPAIAFALTLATQRARWWIRVKQGRAVQDSLDILVDGSEDAARQLIRVIREGQMFFERAGEYVFKQASVAEVLRASEQVLDRISVATAAKNTTTHALDADQFAALSAKAKATAGDVAKAAAEGWNPDQKPDAN
jgi:hypothetical protein